MLFTGMQSLIVNWWQGTFSYISLPFTVGIMMVQSLPFSLILAFTVHRFRRTGVLAAPFLWAGWDWVRSIGFLGYPWGLLGVSQYAQPALLQSAAFAGVWIVNLLPHLTGASTAFLLDPPDFRNRLRLRRRAIPLLISVTGILASALAGALVIRSRDLRSDSLQQDDVRKVRILLIQQNTDPRKNDYQLSFDELSRLTEEAISIGEPFDLVAWSESGFVPDVRFWLDSERSSWTRGQLVRAFLDWQAKMAVPLVTGTQDHFYEKPPPSDDPQAPAEEKRILNSSMYLPPDRRDDEQRFYYYKIRLVPFTENFPFSKQFPWVAELLHNFSTTQWTPGNTYTVHQAPAFDFSTPICFEDVFPGHVRRFVLAGSDVLVNLSNDYWANTPLEGYQHGAHAVFRAVENRRPLVRSTSSGWTISVDTEGRIAPGWPPFYQAGWTVAEHNLPYEPRMTFYTRYGDWFPVLCLAVWAAVLIADLIKTKDFSYGFQKSWNHGVPG
jgi:apolipoprotein N-acyltransferase